MGLEIISWEEFQIGIAPMWGVDDPTTIPIINNPFRVISYPLKDWPTSILYYPFRFVEDGVVKGYTSAYNISHDTVRIRGIWINPEHRGSGAGMRMTKAVMDVFPTGFHRLIGFFKEENVRRFVKHCSMRAVPNAHWLKSHFSKEPLRVLYWDRWPALTSARILNPAFIEDNIAEFGFGGTNNLNRSWSEEDWLAFAKGHADIYPDGRINLSF